MNNLGYPAGAKRCEAMKMHHTTLSRIKRGICKPGGKFIERTVALGIPYNAVFRSAATNAH